MTNGRIVRIAGLFGLAASILLLLEIPLWILPGEPPPFHDAAGHASYLAGIRVVALTRVLMDMLMYMSMMVMLAGFRHLVRAVDERCEWLASLTLVAGGVWWAVSLVADGLEGAAVLNTIGGNPDPTIVRALVEGTLLIYNGAIAFAVTALCMGAAGFAILETGALPRWIGMTALVGAGLCLLSLPAMYVQVVDTRHPYNAVGWIPTIVANIPPLIWMMGTAIAMLRWRDPVS
jgi:hypothetical protein